MAVSAQVPALLISSALCLAVGVSGTAQREKPPDQGANQAKESDASTSAKVSKLMPDLSKRPFQLKIRRSMHASAHAVFEAWTTDEFDRWFAAPGTVIMKPQVDTAYFFEARHEGERHPHYGRFLKLEPDRLVQMTWLTAAGTKGAETVITIELTPRDDGGTELTLTHAGFSDDESRKGHEAAWPAGLKQLDKEFSKKK
jgi:uncharacterized protein YndB with AHSA1/START domain